MANDKTGDISEGEKTQKDSVGNQDKDNSKRIWIFSSLAFVVSIAALIISGVGLNTATTGLIATTRPYLSVDSLTENTTGDGCVSVMIGVTNYGELPATAVEVDKILLDGVPWMGTDLIKTPGVAQRIANVTVTTSGIVVSGSPPEQRDLPNSVIFYPKKHNTFVVTVSEDKWSRSIAPGSVMEIKLNYSWGKYAYWYTAACMLGANGEWNINLERGN